MRRPRMYIFVSSHETPGPKGGCPAARHHVRPAPSPRFPRPCVCCSGALALSTSASLRLHPPARSPPPQVLPPPRPPLRRQLWRQPSYGFSLMPISCLAVAFSMRSRLPPIMVPCIACGAHAVHLQSPYHLLSTYYCRRFTTHCLITHLPLTSRYLHRRVSLLGRGERDEPEALAHLVKGRGLGLGYTP